MPSVKIEKAVFPSQCAELLGVSTGTVSAVKRMLGIERKKVFPTEIYNYLRKNPSFKMSDAYPRALNEKDQA